MMASWAWCVVIHTSLKVCILRIAGFLFFFFFIMQSVLSSSQWDGLLSDVCAIEVGLITLPTPSYL